MMLLDQDISVLQQHRVLAASSSKLLVRGRNFFKIGKHSKPQIRFVIVANDLEYVFFCKDQQQWIEYQSNPTNYRNKIKLKLADKLRKEPAADLEKVIRGPSSQQLMKRSRQFGSPEELIFSLVFKNRTIDLEAETEADRDLWVGNFEWLMKFSKESKVSSPVNVKHVAHVDKEFKWSGNDFEQQIELKKKIGEGAFGEVFLGVHRSAHLQFAIKMLDSQKDPLLTQEITVNSKLELSPEFESEINILKMCRHPNIVNFYGIWGPDKQDKLWIMMDFCVFGAVPDMIRIAEVQINEEQIKWIMKCTLLGLAYLHSKMIIHRDIKPTNILADSGGIIKIADFGVSNQLSQLKSRMFSKKLLGTPLFMAPEILSRGEVSWRADIWALGISAIELADGKNPYAELGAFSAISFIQNSPPPKLSGDWSSEFQDFISSMLKKDPEERASAYELLSHPFLADSSHKSMLDVYIKYCENTGMSKQEKSGISRSFQEAEAKIALIPQPEAGDISSRKSSSSSVQGNEDGSSRANKSVGDDHLDNNAGRGNHRLLQDPLLSDQCCQRKSACICVSETCAIL